jgi:hypothetical protein
MNPKKLVATAAMFGIAALPVHSSTRTSASYAITADVNDMGGARTASASYTNDGSIGLVAGVSTAASPAESVKNGYIGQLYDVTELTVSAPGSTLNETGTLQLTAAQLLDDASYVTLDPTSVSWGVVNGPIASVSSSGLATAGTVYQDTPTTVQGSQAGFSGSLSLTVLDTIADNFGAYASDNLPDDWQVNYFGQPPNPKAAPNVDADGTGYPNVFKYIAGINPIDGSRFLLTITSEGNPNRKNISFTPVVSGRSYTVQYKTTLAGTAWTTLTGTTQSDNGDTRTVNDPGAVAPKFYRVQITMP